MVIPGKISAQRVGIKQRLPEGHGGEDAGGDNGVNESEFLLHHRCENQMPVIFYFGKISGRRNWGFCEGLENGGIWGFEQLNVNLFR